MGSYSHLFLDFSTSYTYNCTINTSYHYFLILLYQIIMVLDSKYTRSNVAWRHTLGVISVTIRKLHYPVLFPCVLIPFFHAFLLIWKDFYNLSVLSSLIDVVCFYILFHFKWSIFISWPSQFLPYTRPKVSENVEDKNYPNKYCTIL